MALTLEQLKNLVEAENLRYYLAPDRPAVMMGVRGLFGSYQLLLSLELEGKFLQFRTIGYLECPAGHRHLTPVLEVLGALNYQVRLVKFGRDLGDGEIVAYVDAWLQDGTLTPEQFKRMIQNYFSVIDSSYGRLKRTLESGKDPGEDPTELLEKALDEGGSTLPSKLAELLKRLKGRGGKPGGGENTDLSEI